MAVRARKLMNGAVSGSLKAFVRRVLELQSSRKFQYLIRTNTSRLKEPAKSQQLRAQCKSGENAAETNDTSFLGNESSLKNGLRHDVACREAASSVNCLIARICKSLSPLTRYVQSDSGRRMVLNLVKPSKQVLDKLCAPFIFRDVFGKTITAMRSAENWSAQGGPVLTRRMLHDAGLGKSLYERRQFSTTANLNASEKKDGKECKKLKGDLPCLKHVGTSDEQAKKVDKNCEKFCMPCCPPARDPPTCIVAQKKRECKKFRPPRPAYSECKKDAMKAIKPCECLIERLPPCGMSDKSRSSKNC